MTRTVLQYSQGYRDAEFQAPLYYRTTEEMLAEFSYFDKDTAYEICVTNPNRIADQCESMKPVPDDDQLYSPALPGAEEEIHDLSYAKAHRLYGDTLPKIVEDRLKLELDAIINHGYAVLYDIAHKLVKHSVDDGYLVGSRGSVGSSFVACMTDITEVNPLVPHYRCPQCRHTEFSRTTNMPRASTCPSRCVLNAVRKWSAMGTISLLPSLWDSMATRCLIST